METPQEIKYLDYENGLLYYPAECTPFGITNDMISSLWEQKKPVPYIQINNEIPYVIEATKPL